MPYSNPHRKIKPEPRMTDTEMHMMKEGMDRLCVERSGMLVSGGKLCC